VIYVDDFVVGVNKSEISSDTTCAMEYSIRILGSNMPAAAWLKNIRAIIVVYSGGAVVKINDTVTFGEILGNGVEMISVSKKSVGCLYRNNSHQYDIGFAVIGISLRGLLFRGGYTNFTVVTVDDKELTWDQVLTGVYFPTRDQGKIKLATQDKGRQSCEVRSIVVT